MWDYDVIRCLISICQKPKYLENEIKILKNGERISY